jgi:subtilisin
MLIEGSDEAILALREKQPGVRLVPIVFYAPAVMLFRVQKSQPGIATVKQTATKKVTFTVQGSDGKAAAGAKVVAFTNFQLKAGAEGFTNAKGTISLNVAGKIERLYVYPSKGYWTAELRNLSPKATPFRVTVHAIDMASKGVLRSFYPNPAGTDGRGVTVGVIDTGSGPHPDLTIAGGRCTVTGESPANFHDNGMQHGTHVAGIIAGHGAPAVRGAPALAPGHRRWNRMATLRLRSCCFGFSGVASPKATHQPRGPTC